MYLKAGTPHSKYEAYLADTHLVSWNQVITAASAPIVLMTKFSSAGQNLPQMALVCQVLTAAFLGLTAASIKAENREYRC